jgi:hypothetical protein
MKEKLNLLIINLLDKVKDRWFIEYLIKFLSIITDNGLMVKKMVMEFTLI